MTPRKAASLAQLGICEASGRGVEIYKEKIPVKMATLKYVNIIILARIN